MGNHTKRDFQEIQFQIDIKDTFLCLLRNSFSFLFNKNSIVYIFCMFKKISSIVENKMFTFILVQLGNSVG